MLIFNILSQSCYFIYALHKFQIAYLVKALVRHLISTINNLLCNINGSNSKTLLVELNCNIPLPIFCLQKVMEKFWVWHNKQNDFYMSVCQSSVKILLIDSICQIQQHQYMTIYETLRLLFNHITSVVCNTQKSVSRSMFRMIFL